MSRAELWSLYSNVLCLVAIIHMRETHKYAKYPIQIQSSSTLKGIKQTKPSDLSLIVYYTWKHVHYLKKITEKKHKNKTKKSACLKNLPPQQVLMFLPRCCTSAIRFSFHRWTPVMAVSRINCPAHAISSSRRFFWMNVSREFFGSRRPGNSGIIGPYGQQRLFVAAGFFQQKKGTLRSENLVKIVENLRNV